MQLSVLPEVPLTNLLMTTLWGSGGTMGVWCRDPTIHFGLSDLGISPRIRFQNITFFQISSTFILTSTTPAGRLFTSWDNYWFPTVNRRKGNPWPLPFSQFKFLSKTLTCSQLLRIWRTRKAYNTASRSYSW